MQELVGSVAEVGGPRAPCPDPGHHLCPGDTDMTPTGQACLTFELAGVTPTLFTVAQALLQKRRPGAGRGHSMNPEPPAQCILRGQRETDLLTRPSDRAGAGGGLKTAVGREMGSLALQRAPSLARLPVPREARVGKVHHPTPNPLRGAPAQAPLSSTSSPWGQTCLPHRSQSLRHPQADSPLTMFSASKPPMSGRSCFSPHQDFSCQGTRSPSSESKQKHLYVVSTQRHARPISTQRRGSAWPLEPDTRP